MKISGEGWKLGPLRDEMRSFEMQLGTDWIWLYESNWWLTVTLRRSKKTNGAFSRALSKQIWIVYALLIIGLSCL